MSLTKSFFSIGQNFSIPHAANYNESFSTNWAFTEEERVMLRHAVRLYTDGTYLDMPSRGKSDVRYFCPKADFMAPYFCIQKLGNPRGEPQYAFRLMLQETKKMDNFPDLLLTISTALKTALPSVRPPLVLVHNG